MAGFLKYFLGLMETMTSKNIFGGPQGTDYDINPTYFGPDAVSNFSMAFKLD
jgi:hypothetical protein